MSESNTHGWARNMTQQLKGLVPLAPNPGKVPDTHMVAYNFT